MPIVFWEKACQALDACPARTMESPLAHLAWEFRFRAMAWLILLRIYRKEEMDAQISIAGLIMHWAKAITMPEDAETCGICRISHLLPGWIETMRQMYLPDDLRSLLWNNDCNCLNR
jgi:hypothetical protein